MIPAGVERDKRIAELRGSIKCIYLMECDCGHTKEQPCVDWEYPYSTDIACAMELWEEMKAAALYPTLNVIDDKEDIEKYGPILCDSTYENAHGGFDGAEYWGQSEADAISGAWLKWKEKV